MTFYDEQQAEVVKQALQYLMTERGQRAINLLAQRDAELHRLLCQQYHKIPWANLIDIGWAERRMRDMPLTTDSARTSEAVK
jgi:hypothetical protein